ncbi:MAG: hypothetical protein DRH17_08320 [Deltaproteobacteria bacterium]|nr:MAG: hypothetical protein DRH17_08320 [Deltaproteobacteria bacterium]
MQQRIWSRPKGLYSRPWAGTKIRLTFLSGLVYCNLTLLKNHTKRFDGGLVEEESFPEQFKKLEDRIEQLVQTCRGLQQAKSELEAKIHDLEGALKAKMATEQQYKEEKSMIRLKIDDLVSRLDQVIGSK